MSWWEWDKFGSGTNDGGKKVASSLRLFQWLIYASHDVFWILQMQKYCNGKFEKNYKTGNNGICVARKITLSYKFEWWDLE